MAVRELPPRIRRLLPLGIVLLAAASYWRLGTPVPAPAATPAVVTEPDRTTVRGETMGTTYAVTVAGATDPAALRAVVQGAVGEVDAQMSTYRQDSELSAFNRAPAGGEPPLSPQLREVFEVALDVGRRSGGAFDVTVGPLVDAWGFGPSEAGDPPSGPQIAALRARSGPGALSWVDGQLHKRADDVRCDLSAVAKGYAVDRVAEALGAAGHGAFLVEVGGELRARGRRLDGALWQVGVERPVVGPRALLRTFPLRDVGVATSGDYRNFRRIEGKRRSHILDPRTGYPANHALASVTVLHPRVAVADAWATALTVLGPQEGMEVARREDLPVLLVVRRAGGALGSTESPALSRYLAEVAPGRGK